MPLLKIFKNMVKKDEKGPLVNEKFIQELKGLSEDDLNIIADSAPGMSNVYIQAEKKRREDEKKKTQGNQ